MNRPRSNALSGPSDPRYRSPAEIELFSAVKTPIPVAQELVSFIKEVFKSKALMETLTVPNDISNGIYSLYSAGGGGSRLDAPTMLSQARDNWSKMRKVLPTSLVSKAFFQYTKVTGKITTKSGTKIGKKAVLLGDDIIFDDDVVALEAADDFLYFPINRGRAACRVYLNLAFQSMPRLVDVASKLPDPLYKQLVDLKTTGPGAGRADSVVIYCASLDAAQKIAAAMADAIKNGVLKSESQSVPAMTTRVAPGVSIGAEPKPQETGLAAHIEGYPPDAQSFGSVRSQIICAAILNYRENLDVLGKDYDVFQQLVAIGFKGYGLDPAAPGS
jgi:hypothetical protein